MQIKRIKQILLCGASGLWLCLATQLCAATHLAQPTETLDHVVAVVNDDIITQTELTHTINFIKKEMAQSQTQTPIPKMETLQKQILEQLINKKLQLQLANQAGLTLTTTELNQAIAHIAQQNHVSQNMLYHHLQQDGLSITEYRQTIHDQLMIQKLQEQEVASKITLSQQEIAQFIKTHPQAQAAHLSTSQLSSLLFQQKFEIAMATWLQKIRNQAFIQIMPSSFTTLTKKT